MQVDDEVFEGIEERATAAGVPVGEVAGQVLTEAEQKRRFLKAAAHFTETLLPAFTAEFGYPTPTGHDDRGAAAA